MDDTVQDRLERAIEKHALINAVKHDGTANLDAIMGPLLGDHAEFREYGDEIPTIAGPVINTVNGLDPAAQEERLQELAPDAAAALTTEDQAADDHALPALPDVDGGPRMRLAPNPNGPWHLGHARMPAVIGTYRDRYDGWFCVRFDDTDPETKRPDVEAYDAILDDLSWLGFDPDAVYRASDRLELYYDRARELIDLGGAYTCSCDAETFSELKNNGEACPHRDKDPETVAEEFEAMIDGAYDPGEMVLRVRTDIEHKNPALRDWVAFRMIDTPHPREAAAEYRSWPMLDFQSAIDDHEIGITHIIRGIDLQDSAKRQQFLYDYFGWTYPDVIHWGHVQIDAYDVPLSTSSINQRVDAGELDGWDDPRAPTLASLRRRGIQPQAIVDAMIELGTSTSNVDLSMSAIYANNRELIDADADRYFFVRDGVRLPISGTPSEGTPPVHPEYDDRGTRSIPVEEAVLLEEDDLPAEGDRLWLKGLGPVRYEDETLVGIDATIEIVREDDVPVVHWVPADTSSPLRLRTPDGDVTGRVEPGFTETTVDELIQFERVGFARVDQPAPDPVAYFAHR